LLKTLLNFIGVFISKDLANNFAKVYKVTGVLFLALLINSIFSKELGGP
jgi:hypothetical protein